MVELSISPGVSSETMSFLGIQSTLDPLWPRVTSLTLGNKLGWDAVKSTLAFLSPRIKNLTLALPRDNSILLQPTLSTVSNRCNSLQKLVLDVVADDPHFIHWVGRLISAYRDTLRTLEISSPFKAEHLPIIANLTRLRNLKLERVHLSSDLPLDAFPALEEITFVHCHGQRLQHFFERLCTTGLKVVKIYAADAITFKEPITALSRFSTTLRDLQITGVTDLVLPSVIVPHLFASLNTVHLECLRREGNNTGAPCAFRPTDRAITELAAAMPNVTHLSLGSPGCSDLRCTTFPSLVTLSKTCKDLDTLVIKVDFQTIVAPSLHKNQDIETDAILDGTQGSACKLRKLVVGVSPLPNNPESVWIVAIGLGKIFPSLFEVVGYGSEGTRWKQVSKNIRILRQVHRSVQQ